MTDGVDRRAIDRELEEHIAKANACMEENKKEIEKISDALFGDDGIVSWAKSHIEAERERRELFKELKKRLILRGTLGAVGILIALLWYGFTSYLKSGATP